MPLTGVLGFQSLLYGFLLLAFAAVVRCAWRVADNDKEKEKDAEHVQNDATASPSVPAQEHSLTSAPTASSGTHRCAVCCSDTTMRCSRCKAARYCSGNCQIIHWRRGHKYECCPPVSTKQFEEENLSPRVAVSETQSDFHEIKGTHAGIADSNNPCSSVNPSVAARKSFDDGRHSRLAEPVSDYTADDRFAASVHPDETVSSPLVPLGSKNSVTASKSFDDGCHSRLAEPVGDYTADDRSAASAHPDETVSSPLVPLESENSVVARKSFDDGRRSRLAEPVGDYTADDKSVASAHPDEKVSSPLVPLESENSVTARKSFDDGHHSRFAEPVSDYTADDRSAAPAHPDKTVSSPSVPLESKNSVNTEVKGSSASKRNKAKSRKNKTKSSASKRNKSNSSNNDDDAGFKSKFPKIKSGTSCDAEPNLGGHEPRRKAAMFEKSVTDTCNRRTISSLNSAATESVADNVEEAPLLSKHKEGPKPSCSVGDQLSTTNKGDSLSFSNFRKTDNYHKLPAKVSDIANQPEDVQSGLKTSVPKSVRQIRGSKESSSNFTSAENETSFPYELFIELYSYDKVKLFPFGLTNCGNSCYANAVLQCLAYTRPLTSYLFQGFHSRQCQKKGWCFICEFECLIQKAIEGNSPLSPIGILSELDKIGSHLGHGEEEDAHEFLRFAVDTMQSICLKDTGKSSPLAEETTLIGYTFGGYLRSKIKCLSCAEKSEKYERMMDLTIGIDGDIGTLEEALGQFIAPETLDESNKYNCSRCKSYEKASKKLKVLEAPNILTIVLKRFQPDNFEKLDKSVQFPEVLNLAPYMIGAKDKSPLYSLYAVVVHLDTTNPAFSGHYVCYVKNIQGEWFRANDSTVEPVELSRVLSERAYMLLYARNSPKPLGLVNSHAISSAGKSERRSKSVATVADSPSLQQPMQCRYPYWNAVNDSINNEFVVYPEQWGLRLNHGGRNTMMDSSSESSSLFSSSDASSRSTVSIKDPASPADFSDNMFREAVPNRSSSNLVAPSNGNTGADFFADRGDRGRLGQDSKLESKAVSYANKNNKKHGRGGGSRGTDFGRYVTANHCDPNYSIHARRSSRDASAQTF